MRGALQIAVALLLLFAAPAATQPINVQTWNVVVLADARTRIGPLVSLEPDCSLIDITVRITKSPAHGKIEWEEGDAFVAYTKGTVREKCNAKKISGATLVFYTPSPGFKGTDTATFEVIDTQGFAFRRIWKITVK